MNNELSLEALRDLAITQQSVIAELRAENEQLQSQVAALVDVIEKLVGPVPNPKLFPTWFIEVMTEFHKLAKQALADTQATADAHDARVREAAIRECVDV